MKNFFSLLMVASTLSLTACGGVSDSSGTNNGSEPFAFARFGQCEVVNNTVIVPEWRGCKMTNPSLNNGKIFGLECKRQPSISTTPTYRLEVSGFESDNIGSVVTDIERAGNGSVLKYRCSSSRLYLESNLEAQRN